MNMPHRVEHVIVAMPAHDEQQLVGDALHAVLDAVAHAGRELPARFRVGVSAHRCSDETFTVAADVLGHGDVDAVVVRDRDSTTVGGVRRRLISVLREPSMPADRTWLFCTDADSVVPRDWISGLLAAARRVDAVAVAGMTDLVDWTATAGERAAYDRIIADGLRPEAAHAHVYAANLAVRLDAYLAAGGFRDVPHGEEHCLLGRIRRGGGTVATPRQPRVRTSGRTEGRAGHGLAALLASLRRPSATAPLDQPTPATHLP
ncbi:glycosyltransferase [Cumulibacter manganitolerans]|uniref:glycosyltransferase n=1 Tax=Cumulibacter manganitolerans TaxID=1884992 RepID=UPI00129554A0|nr:glycosyltransferase [Cumulibacter manganitolerans]